MASEKDLKAKLAQMLGTGVLAATLSTQSVNISINEGALGFAYAFASEGGEGGESGESDESGESGESGSNAQSSSANSSGGANKSRRSGLIPEKFGTVSSFDVGSDSMEVLYSDGWKESIKSGTYTITTSSGVKLISRAARRSDARRLERRIQRKRGLLGLFGRKKK